MPPPTQIEFWRIVAVPAGTTPTPRGWVGPIRQTPQRDFYLASSARLEITTTAWDESTQ